MPPVTLISHLADLQHARVVEAAERHHRLFRRPTAAAPRRSAQVIPMPVVHAADRSACVA